MFMRLEYRHQEEKGQGGEQQTMGPSAREKTTASEFQTDLERFVSGLASLGVGHWHTIPDIAPSAKMTVQHLTTFLQGQKFINRIPMPLDTDLAHAEVGVYARQVSSRRYEYAVKK